MPGQPDWQRFQSSSGPVLYAASGAGPLTSGVNFIGPWRSYFLSATITGGTGVWRVRVVFSTDSLGANVVYTADTIVGNGKPRIGWQPVVAQYMSVTATLTTASTGDTISVNVSPSLLDAPQATRIITTPYLSQYEQVLQHSFTITYDATYIMPGPAILTLRSNQYTVIYDVQAMDSSGVKQNLYRYQIAAYNQSFEYDIQLPDAPVSVKVANFEAHADATYDVRLSPA
jgi:chorismate mutase